ncbi:hypothetical protein PUNSTDRAFT_45499 [Punctularia strigosozonata HHB-11173 SS5]|uniref:uncharacterized protein n=1 Tax=Punctularia strigosozonata (strain HHB-11173) TaxID=741275 RepID=UPI0004417371|nr:uncharacterized protein PUNSTDRAFT_45499 [Punctularia strigosozonata HHB-11173 SS5]EIN06935.1 hypothetical protein PUNSTDRAFT_45499 [Punctularia strigosozonata HHB-11173 SS5]
MAMSLSLTVPAAPAQQPASNGTSPASAPDSPEPMSPGPNGPSTLALPEASLNGPFTQTAQNGANAGVGANASVDQKRKPSRRANTAERRATHNAVERQRRETLNGRFLIRRPSKSAIVNSSIAHVHASRRHRLMAARELRLLKLESDALRRELNEWRDRAGLPRCDEPPRSEAFATVMSGEIELDLLPQGSRLTEEDDGGEFYDDGDDYQLSQPMPMQQQQQPSFNHQMNPAVMGGLSSIEEQIAMEQMELDRMDRMRNPMAHVAAHALLKSNAAQQYQNGAGAIRISHPGASVQLENSIFESHQLYPPGHPAHYAAHAPTYAVPVHGVPQVEKAPSQYFNAQGQHYPPTSPVAISMIQRQQHLGGMHTGHVYGSPVDGDDNASVTSGPPGSAHGSVDGTMGIQGRARSTSSASRTSGYASPSSSFEVPSTLNESAMGMMMKHQHTMTPPISVGGGGNMNGAYAAMMM